MFGKKPLMDNLGRDLDRARDKRNALVSKRDALASDVTTLNAQIAELEARLSEEKDRRERERVGGEIEGIKKRLKILPRCLRLASPGFATRPRRRQRSFPRLASLTVSFYLLRLKSTS